MGKTGRELAEKEFKIEMLWTSILKFINIQVVNRGKI